MKPRIRLLITDLDNTLYDWVTYFARSFSAMVTKAEEVLSVRRDRLLNELQAVHQNHQNSEHPFALLEIRTVSERLGHLSRHEQKQFLDAAFYAFNKERKASLRIYEGVERALQLIVQSGCAIVGHTEATVPNAYFRLVSLGLDRYLTRLFAIEPPETRHPEPGRESALAPPEGFIEIVPRSKRKPNPKLLLDICSEFSVSPSEAVYVGDSLTRDISMAREAGLWAAWAKYETEFDKEYWKTLVEVNHLEAGDDRNKTPLTEKQI